MKYIRTKDGKIIDLKNWSSVETTYVNAETNEAKKDICYQRTWFEQSGDTCEYKTEYISHNSQVLKQADTIEELCDKYVCVEPNGEHTILPSNALICMKGTIVYGAIWTEWGLKYVAKMNDKGELCLL